MAAMKMNDRNCRVCGRRQAIEELVEPNIPWVRPGPSRLICRKCLRVLKESGERHEEAISIRG